MLEKEERIAKLIARSGACSRRDAEKLIEEQRVTYKGKIIDSPAMKFFGLDDIQIDGQTLRLSASRLWLYHKPVGLVVSHNDEQGRETIFDYIPLKERVISIGRLDKNTSGLLLLTNDGSLARKLELPENNFKRTYLVRVFGDLNFPQLQKYLAQGVAIDGVHYRPIKIKLEQSGENNHWIQLTITEGKNREIRKILNYFDLGISKLTRIAYGPFALGDLKIGSVVEMHDWQTLLNSD